MDEEELRKELAALSPIERRELFVQKYPRFRMAFQEITRIERDILIAKGILENLEERKANLEAILLRIAIDVEKDSAHAVSETREPQAPNQ